MEAITKSQAPLGPAVVDIPRVAAPLVPLFALVAVLAASFAHEPQSSSVSTAGAVLVAAMAVAAAGAPVLLKLRIPDAPDWASLDLGLGVGVAAGVVGDGAVAVFAAGLGTASMAHPVAAQRDLPHAVRNAILFGALASILLSALGRAPWVAVLPLVLGAATSLRADSAAAVIDELVRRLQRGVAAVVTWPTFALLGSATLLPAWAVHQGDLDEGPRAGWTSVSRPRTRRRPWRRLALLAAIALAAAGTVYTLRSGPERGEPNAAFADAPWWPELEAETHWAMFDPGVAFNPLRFPPHRDVQGKYLNIRDGYRAGWSPPKCACRRVRVWLYGGSTMFGMGQRDDHTIASELARLAWADGIALDTSNRGVLGDLAWEEAERLAWEVEIAKPPDLAVFYDGYNELEASLQRLRTGSLDRYPVDWGAETALGTDSALARAWRWTFGSSRPRSIDLADADTETETVTDGKITATDTALLADHVMDQYDTARRMATRSADGLPIAWFWQPVSYTSPRSASADPGAGGSGSPTQTFQALQDRLPADVGDLSDTFDTTDRPVFYDAVHTNELGARLVAERMYDELRPQLLSFSQDGTEPPR